jgi:hypothetical protein
MSDTRIDFSALAELRKWTSVNKRRVCASLGTRPDLIIEGTLDECIQQFMLQPEAQRCLYKIHTGPQPDLVGAILSTDLVELARLRDLLGKWNLEKTAGSRCPRPQRKLLELENAIAADDAGRHSLV